VAAGYAAWQHPDALFGTAAAVLLLLFIGVHNAWDGVTYLVFVRRPEVSKGSNASTASSDRRPGPADNTNRE
jgi:hypothetical protein